MKNIFKNQTTQDFYQEVKSLLKYVLKIRKEEGEKVNRFSYLRCLRILRKLCHKLDETPVFNDANYTGVESPYLELYPYLPFASWIINNEKNIFDQLDTQVFVFNSNYFLLTSFRHIFDQTVSLWWTNDHLRTIANHFYNEYMKYSDVLRNDEEFRSYGKGVYISDHQFLVCGNGVYRFFDIDYVFQHIISKYTHSINNQTLKRSI